MAFFHRQLIPLVFASVAIIGCSLGQNQETRQHVGKSVPKISLVSLDTGDESLTLSGKITLLNFWGTWCPPCRQELPGLARLASRLTNEPRFQLIAVSCGGGNRDDLDQLRSETEAFLASTRIALSPWADPTGDTRLRFTKAFGFRAYPTTYLIGADQKILAIWTGYSPSVETQIAQSVARSLKQFPATGSLE
ncbi:MAG: TlpA family protein disulfide reductase [Pirellulales bacterium]|nr:TlpA family protein disulfide reductase [Pirellulales bacterium]|tara:strand:- start:42 stop:620 length:579 start_codon:yes stop_codon:yes gene_type:complete